MKLTRHNPAVFTLDINADSKHTQSIMLASDIHYDSIACDLQKFKEHLQLADELKAPVLIAGDLFDAMQGQDDPRRSPEELKAEYKVSHYFDALVLDASKFIQQFKNVPVWLFGLGNHETSVMKKISTNLCERLAYDLRLHGHKAEAAGYWGYLRIGFNYKNGSDCPTKMIYWHHGNSSNAIVTKGVIDTNRQGVYLHDADVVVNGHNHHAYTMPVQVERVNQRTLEPYTQTVWYIRTPGYKMSSGDSKQVFGFGAEKHRAPTPRGCVFLEMNYRKGISLDMEIRQKIG